MLPTHDHKSVTNIVLRNVSHGICVNHTFHIEKPCITKKKLPIELYDDFVFLTKAFYYQLAYRNNFDYTKEYSTFFNSLYL